MTHTNKIIAALVLVILLSPPSRIICSEVELSLATADKVTLQDASGRRAEAPREIILRSPILAEKLRSSPDTPIILSAVFDQDKANLLLHLFALFYLNRHLPRAQMFKVITENNMAVAEQGKTSWQSANMGAASWPYKDDQQYGFFLVDFLDAASCLQYRTLNQFIAYTLAHRLWITFAMQYPHNVHKTFIESNKSDLASELARFAYLVKDIQLKEQPAGAPPPTLSWGEYFKSFLNHGPLIIPEGSCTFSLQDYLDFKPQAIGTETLDHYMLGDLEGIDVVPNAQITQEINLSHNYLRSLAPLIRLTQLHRLNLSHNQLGELPELVALTNLRELNLAHNRIERLPSMQPLAHLQRLDISHNQIRTLQGANLNLLANLAHIDTANNPVPL